MVRFLRPDKKSRRASPGTRFLTLHLLLYLKVQSKGEMVCDDTFDLLRRIEMARFALAQART